MINTKYATENDLDWLLNKDDVTQEWAERCIENKEYIIASENESRAGFLRYSLFWGKFPYMDMIRVLPEYQKQGVGTALFNLWEQEMRQRNHKLLMTSAEKNELEPQTWHVRNGFTKSGELTFSRHQTVPEIFFVKDLSE
ncbi:MAG: GNAT family N-acetyltransferase [Acidobacteriota bacterium]|nr:GNAT family N-acetyltransferase [Acidobacteriota bacterium]